MNSETLFVTGGTGYIGSVFVQRALAANYTVQVLTRSETSAERVRKAGAQPILGDLGVKGDWQAVAAAAQRVVHLAQPETFGERVTKQRAERYRMNRLTMDAHLLDALKPDVVQRIVYVGGTSYYGDQGKEMRDETARPDPKGWGPYVAEAIEKLDTYRKRGLPIVEAFPAWVYGPASWFVEYTLEPLRAGKALTGLRGPDHIFSPIHVEDCARALLHLLTHGDVGQRYFIVDDRPVYLGAIGETAARALDVPMKTRRVPVFLARMILGPVVADSLTCNVCLSNARLKSTGFTLDYPTIEEGIPDVVARWVKTLPAK